MEYEVTKYGTQIDGKWAHNMYSPPRLIRFNFVPIIRWLEVFLKVENLTNIS